MRRRCGRIAPASRCVMSAPSSRIVPAVGSIRRSSSLPTVDLPQPDSPTRHSVSPGWIAKLDAVDRLHHRARCGRSKPLLSAKCFFRPATSSDRLRHAASHRGEHVLGAVARDRCAPSPIGAQRPALRRGSARSRKAQRGAKAQPAIGSRSDGTMPGISARRALAVLGARAAGSRPSGRACRDAPGGRTAPSIARLLDLAARIHHDHALRRSRPRRRDRA